MRKYVALLMIIIIVGCSDQSKIQNEQEVHEKCVPKNEKIDLSQFNEVIYVSAKEFGGEADGSRDRPFKDIVAAIAGLSELSIPNKAAVIVAEGTYTAGPIRLKEHINLFGGFDPVTWQRDISKHKTYLTGNGEQRIFIASDNTTIDGFIIAGAKFRGKGAAIFCDNASPLISNNVFENNKTLKPEVWEPKYWHETANDGGAVYGTNGSSPIIKNNIFIRNKTENGRGAAVAFDGNCDPQIINNLFYENASGFDDPMRSSDGAAVSIFRWSKGLIEGNIFLSNTAGSNNDGGAVFITLWSSTIIRNNIFVDNECGDDGGALFVGGQEHRYDSPLDPYPPKDKFFVSIDNNIFIGNRNPDMDSGALRYTKENRSEFVNNVVANSNGIYFQRSETEITNNIILDKMLVSETKDYLDKTIIKNNVIWSDFSLNGTIAEIEDNRMLSSDFSDKNKNEFNGFIDDSFDIDVYSAYYLKSEGYSELIINTTDELLNNQFLHRVVNHNSNWGIVKAYKDNLLQVWGDFSAVTSVKILPTYTLKTN